MSNFKLASQVQLRFNTDKGLLSVEQLWSLNLTQLATLIKAIKKVLKATDNDDELSFLTESTTTDSTNQLRFDIVKEIYLEKKKENDMARDEKNVKEHNQKILSLIAQKREADMATKSVEELEAMLK